MPSLVKSIRRFDVMCLKAKPTLKHRPAVWECMLGTVYAMNAAGDCQYFDYDWPAALKFAGVTGKPEQDARFAANLRNVQWVKKGDYTHANPRVGKFCLWILKQEQVSNV